jgi:hypothetical protein
MQSRVAVMCITLLPPLSTALMSHLSNRVSRHSSLHSSAAQYGGHSFANILSNMSLVTLYLRQKIIFSRTLSFNSIFFNVRDASYFAKDECTNWNLPSATFIAICILSFPACTLTKNGYISSSIFVLCNDFSME